MLEMRRRAGDADLLVCPGAAADRLSARGPGAEARVRPAHAWNAPSGWSTRPPSPGPAMLFGTIVNEGGRNYNAVLLADGGRVIGRTLQARAAQLRHVRREARVRLRSAARADRVPRRQDRRSDLRGHLAGAGLRTPRRARAPSCCWSPTAAPTSSTRTTCASGWSRARASRPACRSPTSTASAARTSWCSTARRSSCTPTASSSVQMADWDEQLLRHRLGARRRRLALRRRAASHALDAFPADIYRAMMLGAPRLCRRATAFPGVILGLSGGIDSALSAAVAVDALGPGQGPGRDAAVEIYQRREPRGCARMRPAARLPP